MVVNKRKKNSRAHGSWTHGWGEKKKHRGAGHRGGRGAAGSGKRGDAKKPTIWKAKYFGKYGFTKRSFSNPINIKTIEDSLKSWLAKKKIEEKEGTFIIDLSKLGYDKLLGTGNPINKLQIAVKSASEKAKEKIAQAGGEVKLE